MRWQKKIKFLLFNLKVDYVLTTPKPEESESETMADEKARIKWLNDDEICKGHILNALSDGLFDVYQNTPTAKELRETLNNRYLTEDVTSKKFLTSHFMNYVMSHDRPISNQYDEMMCILGQMKQLNLNMDETISVSCILDKLPPSWKEFRKSLKRKKEDMSLRDLGTHIRVEEETRKLEKRDQPESSKINMIEEGKPGQNSKHSGKKRKSNDDGPKENHSNKKKKVTCWYCSKVGHIKRDCRFYNQKHGNKSKDKGKEKFVAVITEANMVEDDGSWFIDSGTTKHVCKDRSMFTSYEALQDGSVMYMGNSSTVMIKGVGQVDLEFTSGKMLSITNVYRVPDVRKNLVSVALLNKHGFKLVFEGDKFVLTKGGVFVGKGYLYG
ncbi:unnamed protein product, partial [Cuscuta epithymum]